MADNTDKAEKIPDKILKTMRIGRMQVTVFEKKYKNKTFKNIVVSKHFTTGKNNWHKYSMYLNFAEVGATILMLQHIEEFLTKESEKKCSSTTVKSSTSV